MPRKGYSVFNTNENENGVPDANDEIFQSDAAYTARVLLLNGGTVESQEKQGFSTLRRLFSLHFNGLLDLANKGLIDLGNIRISRGFDEAFQRERKDHLSRIAGLGVVSSGARAEIQQRIAGVHARYADDCFLGIDRHTRLVVDDFLPLSLPEVSQLIAKSPINPTSYIFFDLKIETQGLRDFLAGYAKKFANDELDSQGIDLFSYAMHKRYIFEKIGLKLNAGLSPNNLVLNEDEIWPRKPEPAFKVRYVEALLALENEGVIVIKKLNDPVVIRYPKTVVTARDPDNFCNIETQVRVLKPEAFLPKPPPSVPTPTTPKVTFANPHFHFDPTHGVLFRDAFDGTEIFKEDEIQFALLRFAFTESVGTRIDGASVDIDNFRSIYDAARALNQKIHSTFGVDDFFFIDHGNKHIKRVVE